MILRCVIHRKEGAEEICFINKINPSEYSEFTGNVFWTREIEKKYNLYSSIVWHNLEE